MLVNPDRAMRFICRADGGWLLRRQIRNRLYQSYFADGIYGGKEAALARAQAVRDQWEADWPKSQNDGYGRVKLSDARNTCGIIGLSWTYRFRKQTRENRILAVWGGKLNPHSRSFSIYREGLRNAYFKAARARARGIGIVLADADIDDALQGFLEYYRDNADPPDRIYADQGGRFIP